MKALEKKPAKRYQSVGELEAELTKKSEAKEVSARGGEPEIELPAYLVRWQRSDYYLLGVAILGVAIFFGLFNWVYPYSAMKLQITEKEASDKARELVGELGPPPQFMSINPPALSDNAYYQHALGLGLLEANRQSHNSELEWNLFLDFPSRPQFSYYVPLGQRGEPISVQASRQKGENATEPITNEEIIGAAVKDIGDAFGINVSKLSPSIEPFPYPIPSSRWRGVKWDLSGGNLSIKQSILVDFGPTGYAFVTRTFSSLVPLMSSPELAEQSTPLEDAFYRWEGMERVLATPMLGLLFLVMSVLFFMRRLSGRTSMPAFFVASVSALSVVLIFVLIPDWKTLGYWPEFVPGIIVELLNGVKHPTELIPWCVHVAATIFLLLALYALFRVAEHYLDRVLPVQIVSSRKVLHDSLRARPVGLSVLRGCEFGTMYLGLHTILLAGLGTAKLAAPHLSWLDVTRQIENFNDPFMPLVFLAVATLSTSVGA